VAAVGAGGMGDVYRARDPRLGRDIAIKVIASRVAGDPAALSRFEREARAVAALAHPNIVALHDVGSHGDLTYLVTELLEGETLRARLESGGPIAPRRALDYAVQIARGLTAAHERGIVHRDLKPENLFITRDGRVKILDFGVASFHVTNGLPTDAATLASTQSGTFLGTPGYMSPEHVTGEPATNRSDLFAFGIVLQEMLTGKHPFARATMFETLTAILREEPAPLDDLPGLPPAAARIVERCLEKRPEDRPASAADVGFFLEAVNTRGEGSTASVLRESLGISSSWTGLRTRLVALCVGLLLLSTIAIWTYVHVMAGRAVTRAIDADLSRAQATIGRVHRDRLARLGFTARVVASFPEMRALFETDPATLRVYLVDYQNPGGALLIALAPTGAVLARTDDATQGPASDSWFARLLDARGAEAVILIAGRPHHAAAAAAEAGGRIFGYIVAAAPVDQEFAQALGEATQDEVVLLTPDAVLASTLRSGQTPWPSLTGWRRQGGRADRSTEMRLGAQRVAVREAPISVDPPLSAVVIESNEAVEPYRQIQRGVAVIGLLAALVGALGILRLARSGGRL
jgi:Protein kinase domain